MFRAKNKDLPADQSAPKSPGFFKRLRARLNKGDSILTRDLGDLIRRGKVDEELIEELETRMLLADVGVDATEAIIDEVRAKTKRGELGSIDALLASLRDSMLEILAPSNKPLRLGTTRPFVILMVGVNGSGKTTTIGKLARRFTDNGLSVMLAAGDTFRAAAVEQLQAWGERNNVPVIAQSTGADPAAVVYDAFEAAKAREADVLIADTAGRLHTQSGLMDELKKIKRVVRRLDDDAPHEIMLVLDGGIGQNALRQAQEFNDAVGVTGITITKLDGTAKGGILLAIAQRLGIPIRYVGIGEGAEDLGPFDGEQYVTALLQGPDQTDADS